MASLLCININCIYINYSCSEGNNSPSSFFPCSLLVSFLPRRRTKLNAVDLRDQVGSYRVIVSYETELLEAFALQDEERVAAARSTQIVSFLDNAVAVVARSLTLRSVGVPREMLKTATSKGSGGSSRGAGEGPLAARDAAFAASAAAAVAANFSGAPLASIDAGASLDGGSLNADTRAAAAQPRAPFQPSGQLFQNLVVCIHSGYLEACFIPSFANGGNMPAFPTSQVNQLNRFFGRIF